MNCCCKKMMQMSAVENTQRPHTVWFHLTRSFKNRKQIWGDKAEECLPSEWTQLHFGLSTWLSGKESTCQCKRHRRRGFDPWVRKMPWRRKWPPTPVFLPGKPHGQSSLAGYSPWSPRVGHSWALTDALSLLWERGNPYVSRSLGNILYFDMGSG